MKKRILSAVMSMCMTVSAVGISPITAEAATFDETTYYLTGNQRNDIVGIAMTQVGYKEGGNSSQLDGTVQGHGNYTKYNADMGLGQGQPWCACFVTWCAKRAGMSNNDFLNTFSCGVYVRNSKPYKSNGIGTLHPRINFTYQTPGVMARPYYLTVEDYKPRKGDFFLYKGDGSTTSHVGIVVTDCASDGSFKVVDGNNNDQVLYRTEKLSNTKILGFYSPQYNENGSHSHLYGEAYESVHPHAYYRRCACGSTYYTGAYNKISSCRSCYPLGNANLTRSFSKTGKTATFYRNNVANATSYTLTLYKDSATYGTYNMSSAQYTVSGLASGDYTAKLTAVNQNTGASTNAYCDAFTIVNSYPVTFDANGGTNAPAQQEKIHDVKLTITSKAPTKEHYIFKGWATAKNATEVVYEPGSTYEKNAKITLYAVWEPETYTVNFDANGGMGELSPVFITYGDTLRMPNNVFSLEAYLRGWGTSASTSTVSYRLGMDYKIDKNLDLYAIWAASTWANEVADSFAGGSGTADDPYLISDASELAYLAHTVNSQTSAPEYKYYKLTDNIDFNFAQWIPIGLKDMENQYFYGSFDGDGYTVSNMAISDHTTDYVGLFGYVKDSEIKNLNIISDIYQLSSDSQMHVGGVAGYANNSVISGCRAIYGNISGLSSTNTPSKALDFSNAGCIVGTQEGGRIENCSGEDCYMQAGSGSFNMGIIAGYSDGELIGNKVAAEENLLSTSSSVNSIAFGGIVGTSLGTIEKCSVNAGHMSSTVKTQGGANIGGIAGMADGKINLCSVQFTNQDKNSISIEGMNSSTTTELGSVYAGGVVGYMGENAELLDCKYDGKNLNAIGTNSDAGVGGLAGGIKTGSDSFKLQGRKFIDITSLPTKSGYKAKWYTDSSLTTPYNFGRWVEEDVTLYAKWEKEETLPVWNGTSKEPSYNENTKTYTITNGEELSWIADVCEGVITSGNNIPSDKSFSGYTVVLAKDIYLNDTSSWQMHTDPGSDKNRNWKVIGNETYPFKGTFDGQGNTVYGLYHNSPSARAVGLFGCVNGTVENVNMSHVYLAPTGHCYGAIAGYFTGTLSNCHNVYNVTINYTGPDSDSSTIWHVGGMIGYLHSGTVNGCTNSQYTKIYVTAGCYVGGIVGSTGNTDSRIDYCSNAANINANYEVGGIVGGMDGSIFYSHNSGTISYSNGKQGSRGRVGGIAGRQSGNGAWTYDCGNSGTVRGTANGIGGIVGLYYNFAGEVTSSYKFNNCYNLGLIYTSTSVNSTVSLVGGIIGGIVGNAPSQSAFYAYFEFCRNSGNVLGSSYVGGIIGGTDTGYYNVKTTTDYCYNTAIIQGSSYSGGLAGGLSGTSTMNHSFFDCYNSGSTSGDSTRGAILGYAQRGQMTRCVSTSNALYGSSCGKVSNYNSYTNIAKSSITNYINAFKYDTALLDTPYVSGHDIILKRYNITPVTKTETVPMLSRSFANIDGSINTTASKNASSGGILGAVVGNGTKGSVPAENLLTIADGIYSTSSGSSYHASSGLITGKNTNSAVSATGTYAHSDIELDATNTASSSNISEDSSCTEQKPTNQITRASFLTTVFGPTAYKSLKYLDTDETAVWVIKNGQLPELYYNCLNDITVSDGIEHGKITLDTYSATDGEIVTITPAPDEGYELNKFYVNGEEGVGTTFEVKGESEVYAIFTPVKEEYDVTLEANDNATASLANADSLSLMSTSNSITAEDGEEIMVSASADALYTIDSVVVNGEEIAGNSFILDEDTVVSLSVSSIDTNVYAITDDAKTVGSCYAVLGGSIVNGNDESVKYIRYWETANPDMVYTTGVETGSGSYEATIEDLIPETSYSYQMLDEGEVKTFQTLADIDTMPEEITSETEEEEAKFEITVDYTKKTRYYLFDITASEAVTSTNTFIAIYDENDNLLYVEALYFDGGDVTDTAIDIISGANKAKVFIWDEDMKPLCITEPVKM